jgi:hypothetical protein
MDLALEDCAMMLNRGGHFNACVKVQGDRFIVGTIRFKGCHSIKISKFNEKNKPLITYPSLDYPELPYHLTKSSMLNHTSYESFELCILVQGIFLD